MYQVVRADGSSVLNKVFVNKVFSNYIKITKNNKFGIFLVDDNSSLNDNNISMNQLQRTFFNAELNSSISVKAYNKELEAHKEITFVIERKTNKNNVIIDEKMYNNIKYDLLSVPIVNGMKYYSNNLISYSGNKLTGVPKFVNVSSLKLFFLKGVNLFISYNYTDKIPLNDGNSVYAASYHLFGSKVSWEYKHKNRYGFQLFAGVENLLNASYSLGNDLNAVGNRYYNPAPTRTYYCGIQLKL